MTVVAVKPQTGTAFTHAGTDSVLTYGDQIVIGGHPADVEKFVELPDGCSTRTSPRLTSRPG